MMDIVESYECRKKVDGKFHIYVKVIVKQDDEFYLGKWNDRRGLPDDISQLEDLRTIPTRNRGPDLQHHWTTVQQTDGLYVKKPATEDYLDPDLENYMRQEINICEVLNRSVHPNLTAYHGCRVGGGKATGLVFKRYKCTLLELVNPQRLSKRHFMAGSRLLVNNDMRDWLQSLRSAARHLHDLGLVHNDMSPANVMLDEDEQPVLIDFGSTCRLGSALAQIKRTVGWHDESVSCALETNDLDAVDEMETWLFGQVESLKFDG